MVKEAIFSIVQFDVPGRRVLDLFAGTGQLGIEALSRGARECVFVDNSPASLALVRKNLAICGMEGTVVRSDALAFLRHAGKFDLVFVDPPYQAGLYGDVLDALFSFDILNEGGIILVESMRNESMPAAVPPYEKGRTYSYGRISLTAYTR
jgi:16S rRNA (guanine(966)-N(2))-methyltransferase RsmD